MFITVHQFDNNKSIRLMLHAIEGWQEEQKVEWKQPRTVIAFPSRDVTGVLLVRETPEEIDALVRETMMAKAGQQTQPPWPSFIGPKPDKDTFEREYMNRTLPIDGTEDPSGIPDDEDSNKALDDRM